MTILILILDYNILGRKNGVAESKFAVCGGDIDVDICWWIRQHFGQIRDLTTADAGSHLRFLHMNDLKF